MPGHIFREAFAIILGLAGLLIIAASIVLFMQTLSFGSFALLAMPTGLFVSGIALLGLAIITSTLSTIIDRLNYIEARITR